MELPVTFHNKIVEFLTSLPNIHDSNAQRALIHSASLDARLQSEILFGGSSQQFFQLLIPTLRSYGNLADNRDPLEAVLEAAKADDGSSRRTECDRHTALCMIFTPCSDAVECCTILRHSDI